MMKLTFCTTLLIAMIGTSWLAEAAGPDEHEALGELDAKISGSLQRRKWSESSRQVVRALWGEYKQAFVRNERPSWAESRSDIKGYQEYLGRYARAGKSPEEVFIEVLASAQDRFMVKVEGHTIPAVAWNGGILFTTGDVVYDGGVPHLGTRPHCTLEYLCIRRVGGQHYATTPGSRIERAVKLIKLKRDS